MSSRNEEFFKRERSKALGFKDQLTLDRASAKAVLSDLFERQCLFVTDPFRRKSLLCPRRSGKTHTTITHALWTGLLNPGCHIPVIALTLKSSAKLYWDPLRQFSTKYGLGIVFKVGERCAYLPNGSRIFLSGCESMADVEKLRGGAYKLAIVDEGASINPDIFEYLVFEVLSHATNDVSGSIAIVGTPGDRLSGIFYEATCDVYRNENNQPITKDFYSPEKFWGDPPLFDGKPITPQWNRHHWSIAENVFCPELWENACELKRARQWSDDHPVWVRESLGRWLSTEKTMVYAVASLLSADGTPARCRCLWKPEAAPGTNKWGLPLNSHGEDDWSFVLGMDLGFEDAFAIVVVAWSPSQHALYHVYDEKWHHLIVSQVAAKVKSVVDSFDGRIEVMIADTGGLGKMVVASLNEEHGFFIEAADKREKLDHIELLNNDLYEGRLKLIWGGALVKEQLELKWDYRGLDRDRAIRMNRLREDPKSDNHLCDALLYTWRYCYHRFSVPLAPPVVAETPQFFHLQEIRELEEAIRELDSSLDDSIDAQNRMFSDWSNI